MNAPAGASWAAPNPPARAVGSSVLVALIGASGLFAGAVVLAAWNVQRAYRTNALVAHTYQVQAGLEQLLQTLIDAETGQRGFIITSEERCLEPYQAATGQIPEQFDKLRQLTADDPAHAGDVMTMSGLARLKLDELAETIRLHREVGFNASQERSARATG